MSKIITINTTDLKSVVNECVKRLVSESFIDTMKYYVVDDGGVYNVFSSDMFDKNGNYIEDMSLNLNDMDIVKTTNSEEQAWAYAEKMNREQEESSYDFAPSRGYFDESINKNLSAIIRESVQKVLLESYDDEDFDNVTPEQLASFNNNYYDVIVPEWALPALVNGDYEGLSDEDIADVKAFERNFMQGGPCELANGLNAGDCCIPLEGKAPSFYPKNDINGKGADCYKFAFPAK